MAILDKVKEAVKLPTEQELQKAQEQSELAFQLFSEFEQSETLYSQVENDLRTYKDFYVGERTAQWNGSPEGEIQLVANMGAAIIDLFTYILANNPPTIQFVANGPDPVSKVRADFGEEMANQLLIDARFPIRFRDAAKNHFMLGYALLYPFWNKDRKDGGEKGTFDLTALNPFTTRIIFDDDDYERFLSYITWTRVHPDAVLKKYGEVVHPDWEYKVVPSNYEVADDQMVTVFTRFDEEKVYKVANGRVIWGPKKHGLKTKPPLYKIDNIRTPGDPMGRPEIERWLEVAQEINALLTAASEIARDLGYPPLLEINNALGGRKPTKWRNQKIPVKESDKKEAVRYLINPAQITPLLKQAEFLINILHFVSLMPKAASGVFQTTITSGFQAKLAMQPATLATDARKVDWDVLIKELIKDAFVLLKENNPEALTLDLSGEEIDLSTVADHEIQVIWSDALAVDIAREIQNLVLGLQNNMTSVTQAVDRYNALMGMGSPSDTFEYLKQESGQPEINPKRALEMAKVKEQLGQLSQTMNQANVKLSDIRQNLNNGENPLPENLRAAREAENPVNFARGAASPLPDERRPVNPARREAVNPNSTGGVAISPDTGPGIQR